MNDAVITLGIRRRLTAALILPVLLAASSASAQTIDLVGAWRASVSFSDGPFAAVGDLEFLYAFNAGGTMTESSNYDGAPPVPPAYGIWRRIGAREFEAKYVFFVTRAPASFPDISGGGGWLPAGYGVLTERIALAPDGRSFTSAMHFEQRDARDSVVATGTASVRARRIEF